MIGRFTPVLIRDGQQSSLCQPPVAKLLSTCRNTERDQTCGNLRMASWVKEKDRKQRERDRTLYYVGSYISVVLFLSSFVVFIFLTLIWLRSCYLILPLILWEKSPPSKISSELMNSIGEEMEIQREKEIWIQVSGSISDVFIIYEGSVEQNYKCGRCDRLEVRGGMDG